MKTRTLVFYCSLLMLTSASAQDKIELFQNKLDSIFLRNPESVGLMVHVEAPDQSISWTGVSGYSDKLRSPLDPRQPALIASSIKTLVSATILRLVEEGKLSIDDSIDKFLSPSTQQLFTKDGYVLSTIKVKHLLSHTSGIANYANEAYVNRKDSLPEERWTRDAQLALTIAVGNPLSEPGVQFSYTDANYLLLTEIIESLTDMPFYSAMRQLLRYEEIGLKNTWFPTLEEKPRSALNMVHQYWGAYEWDSHAMDVSWDLYGGGGIACPPKELALFAQAYFTGKIVKNDSIRDLIFTYIPTPETAENKYFLGLSADSHHGLKAYGHGGFWGTTMMYFPEINATISVYVLERDKRILRHDIMESISAILIGN